MLEHLRSQSFLDYHRRILIEANLNNIKDHPFDHGLSEQTVLNLHLLDHRGNYEREMDEAYEQMNTIYKEENPFDLNRSLELEEKDQIIYWSMNSKNPKLKDLIAEKMPGWIKMIKLLKENPNYLYDCKISED